MNDDINANPQWAPPGGAPQPRRSFGGLGTRGAGLITAIGLATGGLAGGFIISHAATSPSAAPSTAPSGTGSTAPSGSAAAPAAPNAGAPGTFHSNEDAAHEAGESAAREAAENSGQFPGPPPAANGTAPGGAGIGTN